MTTTTATASPFQLTEEQLAVQAAARDFAQSELWEGDVLRPKNEELRQ